MVDGEFSFESISVATMDSASKVPAIVTTSSAPTSSAPTNRHSLGAALDAFERRLSRAGIALETTPPHGFEKDDSSFQDASARVLRCWKLVDLAMAQAVEYGQATEDNVVCIASISAVIPGNIVALYHPQTTAFLRIYQNTANYDGGRHKSATLPMYYDCERFLVVSGGCDGSVAFFNPTHKRFLEINSDGCTIGASSSQALHLDDRPRCGEKFEVKEWPGSGGTVCLFKNRPVQCSFDTLEVYQVKGLDF